MYADDHLSKLIFLTKLSPLICSLTTDSYGCVVFNTANFPPFPYDKVDDVTFNTFKARFGVLKVTSSDDISENFNKKDDHQNQLYFWMTAHYSTTIAIISLLRTVTGIVPIQPIWMEFTTGIFSDLNHFIQHVVNGITYFNKAICDDADPVTINLIGEIKKFKYLKMKLVTNKKRNFDYEEGDSVPKSERLKVWNTFEALDEASERNDIPEDAMSEHESSKYKHNYIQPFWKELPDCK